MPNNRTRFGTGQGTCKVCNVKLEYLRRFSIKIKHSGGSDLVNLDYFVPLCPAHSGDGSLDVNIGWLPGTIPLDETKE
jgi:hypothetical protein